MAHSILGEARTNALRQALLARRERLLGESASLAEEVLNLAESRREESGLGGDSTDAAADLAEEEMADSLGHVVRAGLEEINYALARIDDERFGVCEDCHEPIDPARLSALPWARRCLACQRRSEHPIAR